MMKKKVKLITSTENPLETVYIAAKTCYTRFSPSHIKIPDNREELVKFVSDVMRSGHLSVIEHISYTFSIENVSRALLAQITRHRIASFSVQSMRYVDMSNLDDDSFYIPDTISDKVAISKIRSSYEDNLELYKELQELGVKNEDARMVLPNASPTNIIMTMNARELIHFFNLRCCNRAQLEIREVANEMRDIVIEKDPGIFEMFAGPSCVTLGYCPEDHRSCGLVPTLKNLKYMAFQYKDFITEQKKHKEDILKWQDSSHQLKK